MELSLAEKALDAKISEYQHLVSQIPELLKDIEKLAVKASDEGVLNRDHPTIASAIATLQALYHAEHTAYATLDNALSNVR
jgi:hypothetical protein